MIHKALMLMSMIIIGIVIGSVFHLTYISGEENNDNFQTNPTNQMRLRLRNPLCVKNLTDAQEQEIQQLIQDMKDSGASREDVMNAVKSKLAEWGIEPCERHELRNQPWTLNLTDSQRREILQLVQEMKEAGSSQQEIRKTVDAKLEQWGIKIPERQQPPFPQWLRNLTDAQKAEIQQLIRDMNAHGASQQEIRKAVNAKLAEWDVKAPEAYTCKWPMRNQTSTTHMLERLTEDQRNELHQKIWELKQSGASPAEIRNIVQELLEEWGVIPENQ
jgi:DNA-binding transcriptional regulator YhcF (GntR family)